MRYGGGGRPDGSPGLRRLVPLLWVMGVLAVIVSAFVTARPRPARTLPEQWLTDALAPVQGAAVRAGRSLVEALGTVGRLGRLRQENQQLRGQLEQLQLQLSLLAGVAAENRELRRALDLPEVPGYRVLVAEVIQRRPSRWYAQVVVNRGSEDGVGPLSPVVAPAGVVGHVVSVTRRTATVGLISDPEAATGGRVVRSGDLVLVEGLDEGRELKIRALTPQAAFEAGDVVVTSGLGGVYPRGIMVGTVRWVRELPGGLGREGRLSAAADLDRLSVVYILVPAQEQP